MGKDDAGNIDDFDRVVIFLLLSGLVTQIGIVLILLSLNF